MSSLIEDAIAAAANLRRRSGEDRIAFAGRLITACDTMNDEEWESLTEEQKAWANLAIRAQSDGKDLPAYPDEVPDPEPEPAPEPEPVAAEATEEESDVPAAPARSHRERLTAPPAPTPVHRGTVIPPRRRRTAAPKAAPRAAAPKAAKANGAAPKAAPKAAKVRRADDKSGVAILRNIVVKSPNATVEQLRERILKRFPSMSDNTIQSVRAATRSTMKLLPEYASKIN